MHQHEERYNKSIVILVSPAIIVGYFGPSPLRQYLHHDVLWVNKGFVVGELNVVCISWLIMSILLSGVEDLHSYDAEEKENERKDKKKSCDNGKNLYESLKEPFDLLGNLNF